MAGVWLRLDAADCVTASHPARLTDAAGAVRFEGVLLGMYCLRQAAGAGETGAIAAMSVAVGGGTTHVVVAAAVAGHATETNGTTIGEGATGDGVTGVASDQTPPNLMSPRHQGAQAGDDAGPGSAGGVIGEYGDGTGGPDTR